MGSIRSYSVALAALAPGALAALNVNNWCDVAVSFVSTHSDGCETGADGGCTADGSEPWRLEPGTGESIATVEYIEDGVGASIKISKDDVPDGVLQFEYNVSDFLYYDLSDLDGNGGGLVGTPFADQNVKVTPTGNGALIDHCIEIRCTANEVCLGSYQDPNDVNTNTCPLDTGDLWLDLCMPPDIFDPESIDSSNHNATESTAAASHQRRHLGAHRLAGHKRHF